MSIQLTTGILQQIKNRGSAISPYLLDTYTGAAAAYSLRQLKTGVTSVVRVRRSSDNVEADFTALEITNGTLTTWTGANDGFVVTWYDQSGNDWHFSQSTAANQPKLVTSGVVETQNSNAIIDFGVNQVLQRLIQNTQVTNATTGYFSQFMVASSYGAGTANGWYYFTQQPTANIGRFIETPLSINSIRSVRFRAGGTSSPHQPTQAFTAASAQNQFLATSVCGNLFIDISVNNSTPTNLVTDNDYKLTGSGDSFMGGNGIGNAQSHKVKIGMVLFYADDKSADRAGITTAINNMYGIY